MFDECIWLTCECDPCMHGLAASFMSSASEAAISPQFLQIPNFHSSINTFDTWFLSTARFFIRTFFTIRVFRNRVHHIHIATQKNENDLLFWKQLSLILLNMIDLKLYATYQHMVGRIHSCIWFKSNWEKKKQTTNKEISISFFAPNLKLGENH